eukprot:gene27108-biopygen6700
MVELGRNEDDCYLHSDVEVETLCDGDVLSYNWALEVVAVWRWRCSDGGGGVRSRRDMHHHNHHSPPPQSPSPPPPAREQGYFVENPIMINALGPSFCYETF